MTADRERYAEFLRSGPLKRVYVDIPEKAHAMLGDLARKNGIPMKAMLTLLIADAVAKPNRVKKVTKKPARKKRKSKKRSKK